MEGRLFTFLGSIGGHDQVWIILSHFVLVILIVFEFQDLLLENFN